MALSWANGDEDRNPNDYVLSPSFFSVGIDLAGWLPIIIEATGDIAVPVCDSYLPSAAFNV